MPLRPTRCCDLPGYLERVQLEQGDCPRLHRLHRVPPSCVRSVGPTPYALLWDPSRKRRSEEGPEVNGHVNSTNVHVESSTKQMLEGLLRNKKEALSVHE